MKFIENTAQNKGGAVFQKNGNSDFLGCTFTKNGVLSADGKGGAYYLAIEKDVSFCFSIIILIFYDFILFFDILIQI